MDESSLVNFEAKYPQMVRIYLEAAQDINLQKTKYLVSKKITGVQLATKLKQSLFMTKKESMYLFICSDRKREKKISFDMTDNLGALHKKYQNQKGYLKIFIATENTY